MSHLCPSTVYTATSSLSVLLNMVFHTISPSIDRLLLGRQAFLRIVISRLYTLVFFVNYMLFWSSFWNIFGLMLTTDPSYAIVGIITVAFLVCSRFFNTVNGVPASIVVDTVKNYCTSATLLRVPTSFLFSSLFDKL